jgi:hypothetical protein
VWQFRRPQQRAVSEVIEDGWSWGRATSRVEGNPQDDPSDPAF